MKLLRNYKMLSRAMVLGFCFVASSYIIAGGGNKGLTRGPVGRGADVAMSAHLFRDDNREKRDKRSPEATERKHSGSRRNSEQQPVSPEEAGLESGDGRGELQVVPGAEGQADAAWYSRLVSGATSAYRTGGLKGVVSAAWQGAPSRNTVVGTAAGTVAGSMFGGPVGAVMGGAAGAAAASQGLSAVEPASVRHTKIMSALATKATCDAYGRNVPEDVQKILDECPPMSPQELQEARRLAQSAGAQKEGQPLQVQGQGVGDGLMPLMGAEVTQGVKGLVQTIGQSLEELRGGTTELRETAAEFKAIVKAGREGLGIEADQAKAQEQKPGESPVQAGDNLGETAAQNQSGERKDRGSGDDKKDESGNGKQERTFFEQIKVLNAGKNKVVTHVVDVVEVLDGTASEEQKERCHFARNMDLGVKALGKLAGKAGNEADSYLHGAPGPWSKIGSGISKIGRGGSSFVIGVTGEQSVDQAVTSSPSFKMGVDMRNVGMAARLAGHKLARGAKKYGPQDNDGAEDVEDGEDSDVEASNMMLRLGKLVDNAAGTMESLQRTIDDVRNGQSVKPGEEPRGIGALVSNAVKTADSANSVAASLAPGESREKLIDDVGTRLEKSMNRGSKSFFDNYPYLLPTIGGCVFAIGAFFAQRSWREIGGYAGMRRGLRAFLRELMDEGKERDHKDMQKMDVEKETASKQSGVSSNATTVEAGSADKSDDAQEGVVVDATEEESIVLEAAATA